MKTDYSTVTELPGNKASKEQLQRLFHRYHFASQFCKDKDVLEVACGAGMGLGYLAKFAKKIVGGDIEEESLKHAYQTYKGRENIEIKKLDAHNLPFEDNSFDVVILYEAIYYLSQPEKFVDESKRVLREGGVLIICTVNKDWADFNPSPYSVKYFSVPELYQLLNQKFSKVETYGAFSTLPESAKDKIISLIKRTAVTLHLIPKTMKGKEFFKRIFFGKLIPLPNEIKERIEGYIPPIEIPYNLPTSQYKVIYALAYA
jgi:ubiquinone/menaquinone biosynthesis C-methylase UbiE